MPNGSTLLPDLIPLPVVAKLVGTLAAILLAWGSVKGDIKVLQNEIGHLNERTQRIEEKLDQLSPRYGFPEN